MYLGNDKSPIFSTDMGKKPPFTTSFYSVKETMNSSCRFLRITLNSIPISQSLLNETNLILGISLQPFTEIPIHEKEIPKAEAVDRIFRCKTCQSYINSKYKITYSKSNKQVAICNICNTENELDSTKPGCKNEYCSNNFSFLPELTNPTVDFIAPSKFKNEKEFKPHYLFLIDISQNALLLNLPSYILNSIQGNLDMIHNAENSYIAIAFYDTKAIYFYYMEKNEIRLSIMCDLNDPFCPINMNKLYFNVISERFSIEKMIEKLNSIIISLTEGIPENALPIKQSTPTGSAIKAGVNSLIDNGGRVMVFTPNMCQKGYAACIPREKINKEKDPEKANPFYSQHEILNQLAEICCENAIVVDQFIFYTSTYDLATFATISNLTGGQMYYYQENKDIVIQNSNYEKLHYDLTRILTRPNYYYVNFKIRFSPGVECYEILGPFNKKLGEAFTLGGCDPDFSFFYNLRLSDTFKVNQVINFQIACLFTDNYGKQYIRIFNSSFQCTDKIADIFIEADVDAIAKGIIMKEISLTYRAQFEKVKLNLEERIINSFKYYRTKVKSQTPREQLILPLSLRYLPLYFDSFIKKGLLSKKQAKDINELIALIHMLMRTPIYKTIKFLYPKFYRIDDIQRDQSHKNTYDNTVIIKNIGLLNEQYNIIQKPYLLGLSKDNIDLDCAYLIDNAEFITVVILDQIDSKFYIELFGVDNWTELKNKGIDSLDEENQNDLNVRILNIISQLRAENSSGIQPVRLLLLAQEGLFKDHFEYLMVEDEYNGEKNYSNFLLKVHTQIMAKI